MPGFIYFFPVADGRQIVTAQDFEAAGFGHALTGKGITCCTTSAGPDGLGGVIAVPDRPGAPRAKFDKSAQVWRKGKKRVDKGVDVTAYVGVDKAEKPGPEDLQRDHVFAGNAVRLLDGKEWIVPRCHAVLEERPSTLPRILDVAEDGETPVSRIQPAFEQLSSDAFRWWMDWSGQSEETKRLSPADQVRLAVAALAVNYRVGLLEVVALLGLWGTVEFGLVLRAMIDADEVDAYVEKKAQEALPPAT